MLKKQLVDYSVRVQYRVFIKKSPMKLSDNMFGSVQKLNHISSDLSQLNFPELLIELNNRSVVELILMRLI